MNVASGRILAASHLDIAAQRLELPGSTIKPFVLMELLNTGKIQAQKRLVCRRPLSIAGHRMDCTHPASMSSLDAREALAWSCNSYFAEAATQLTATELQNVLQHSWFTARPGFTGNEVAGRVSMAVDQAHLQLQALGNWGIEVTPLELLAAYRNLALQRPRWSPAGTAAPVFAGMEHAVRYGMAHAAQPEGITAAGKTGTAPGLNTPYSHGFFVGYAPADKPEIVLVVYLEHSRGIDAAAIAAPIFTAYAQAMHGASQ
jgi:penicillin-binding protein 2